MMALTRMLRSRSDEGASAVEYGLLVAAIAAIIILVVFALGGWVKGSFKDTCDKLANGPGSASTTTTQSATCSS